MTIKDFKINNKITTVITERDIDQFSAEDSDDKMTNAVQKATAAISNEIPNINLLEVLDNMIAIKEIDVFISGYSDNEIHPCDIRLELLALYKARDLFTKEETK